ncbi:MAG TPA: GNAT family protein [Glaciibacter sp.]|nr:GNAT family protein [Glaciibacter sp.]
MTAVRPEPAVLAGRYIQLEPLREEHLPELHAAIAHPAVFASGYGGGPAGLREDVDEFVSWGRTYYPWDQLPHAVRVLGGPNDGVLVGTSSLADIDLEGESIHLGWTAYDPRVWGTAVNAEAKLLLLERAFDHGFGRVHIQADAVNERSRAAIAGIGATFEGITRRHMLRADGTWRDSAVFSVLIDEWPRVRAGLEARLERYEERPIEFRTDRE